LKIITISAKARHGKDFTAELIKKRLEQEGNRVLIAHYGDLLKYICITFFKWNGEKDDVGRTLLQHVGTDIIRKEKPDYWVDFLISIFNLFPDEWDYVIIPDTRFPNENSKLKDEKFKVITVRIVRPNFDNGLTEEQKAHESEMALDDYHFDYLIVNHGDKTINGEVDKFIDYVKLRSVVL
jgi:hypothetical protein